MAENERSELKYLKQYYEKDGSQILVLYGQKNMGLTDMVRSFCAEKPALYYRARPCSEREQLYQWGGELREEGAPVPEFPSYAELFAAVNPHRTDKTVIVIEEFQNIIRQSETFMPELISFIRNKWSDRQVLTLLCSSSIGWVENSMVRRLGTAAASIQGFIKMKEQSFFDMARMFPGYSESQQIEAYAVLGGFPELWSHFTEGLSVRDNICRHILRRGSFLHEEALRLVSDELRETNVYHAILAAMALGRQKLNELHLHTGFSRAKISVYLKNLMELEIVEKVFSYDTAGRENARKGIYRIQNHFVHFYFRYLYPHTSRLASMEPEEFYDTYIAPDFKRFTAPCFSQICREYMERMNRMGKLPFTFTRSGEWVGKVGNIDIAAQDDMGHTLIGLCSWEKPLMPYEDYEWLMFCAEKARLEADYIYLFSAAGFDDKLIKEAENNSALLLKNLGTL